jgi:hypothetical protein
MRATYILQYHFLLLRLYYFLFISCRAEVIHHWLDWALMVKEPIFEMMD